MNDQINSLKKKGIKALSIHSGMSYREVDRTLDNAVFGDYKFLYVSPERLKTDLFKTRFVNMNISFVAIDEAHCISQWGYDFRPAYLDISSLKEIKPDLKFIALTASATKKVVKDIASQLDLKNPLKIQKSFERKNLKYITLSTNNKIDKLVELVKKIEGSGIIYCNTRKDTKFIYNQLHSLNIKADFYHGGLEHSIRNTRQQNWMDNKTRVMIATNAFGMGIDKPDVRFVLHYTMPENLENYFQEAGRAGRDGKPARSIVLHQKTDNLELISKHELKFPSIDTVKQIYTALGSHLQLAIGSGKNEKYAVNIGEFANKYNQNIFTCYASFKILERCSLLNFSENNFSPSRLKILVENYELYQFQVKDAVINTIIQFVLRSHVGIFDHYLTINEFIIAKKTKLKQSLIIEKLKFLDQHKCVDYQPTLKGNQIEYLTERLDNNNYTISKDIYLNHKNDSKEKLEAVIEYLSSQKCNSEFILQYFGEENTLPCGQCNVCLNLNEKPFANSESLAIRESVTTLLSLNKELHINDLILKTSNYPKEQLIAEIRIMEEAGQVNIDKKNLTVSLKN